MPPRVVRSRVSGINATPKSRSPRPATVKLTPSTPTEPFSTKSGRSAVGGGEAVDRELTLSGLLEELTDAIDMAGQEMATQAVAHTQTPFQIDLRADDQVAEGSLGQALRGDREARHRALEGLHGHARPGQADRVAEAGVGGQWAQIDAEPQSLGLGGDLTDLPQALHQAREHGLTVRSRGRAA